VAYGFRARSALARVRSSTQLLPPRKETSAMSARLGHDTCLAVKVAVQIAHAALRNRARLCFRDPRAGVATKRSFGPTAYQRAQIAAKPSPASASASSLHDCSFGCYEHKSVARCVVAKSTSSWRPAAGWKAALYYGGKSSQATALPSWRRMYGLARSQLQQLLAASRKNSGPWR